MALDFRHGAKYICKDFSKIHVSTRSTSRNVFKYKYKCFQLKSIKIISSWYKCTCTCRCMLFNCTNAFS